MIWRTPDGEQMLELSLVPPPPTDDPQLIKFTNLGNGTEHTAPYRSDKPLEQLGTEGILAHWKERGPSRP